MTPTSAHTAPPPADATAPVGIIGGSGLYRLLTAGSTTRQPVATPYGSPSAEITLGRLGGKPVAFLPRHGAGHTVAPHRINYRANIWALASLGVRAIVSTAAVGGLSPQFPPGLIVLPDQLLDRTTGRADTFYDEDVQHLPAADPFDPELRAVAQAALTASGEEFAGSGTAVILQGPRFATRAESLWHRSAGAQLANMTLLPEVTLAEELNMGTVTLAFITDTDAGTAAGEGEPVTAELVFARLAAAQPRLLAAIEAIVRDIPESFVPRQLVPAAAVRRILDAPTRGTGE